MIDYWDYWLYGYDAGQLSSQGMMSTLPVESERDLVAELHQAVEDVTRKPVQAAPRRPMGFY